MARSECSAALVARTQTGRGQYVDISMMDGSAGAAGAGVFDFFRDRQYSAARRDHPTTAGSRTTTSTEPRTTNTLRSDRSSRGSSPTCAARSAAKISSARIRFSQARGNRMSSSPRHSRPKPATNGSRFLSKTDICVGRMSRSTKCRARSAGARAQDDRRGRRARRPEGQAGRHLGEALRNARLDPLARAGARAAYGRNSRPASATRSSRSRNGGKRARLNKNTKAPGGFVAALVPWCFA